MATVTQKQQESLVEGALSQLLEIVESEELSVGSYFPSERSLSERLGVSRTVIREAVHILEQKVQGSFE